jgi:P4 family phage/plasmid primase-like protien
MEEEKKGVDLACYLVEEILPNLNGSKEKANLINQSLELVSNEDKITQSIVINKISELTKIPKNELKQTVEETEKEEYKTNKLKISGLKITSYQENVELFYEQQPFFYDKSGIFWFWNLKEYRYEIKDDIDVINAISEGLDFAGELVTSGVRRSYLNAFKDVGRKYIPKEPDKNWVQFKDKIINIHSLEEFAVSSEYFFTNPIPFKMGKCGDTPILDSLFHSWVEDSYVPLLYEIIAYCMIRHIPIHRIFCLFGAGRNGKSVYLSIVEKFLGVDNCTTTELDRLMISRFEVAGLYKKCMCRIGETDFAEMKKTALLKELSAGGRIMVEFKNKTPTPYYNYAKIIVATNNVPASNDKTDAYFARWLLIDFPNRFSEKEDAFSWVTLEEYENLAYKCVRILRELLLKREFTNEGSIDDRRKKYEELSNPLGKFWKDNIIETYGEEHIFKYDMYKRIKEWLVENRFRAMGEATINKFIKNMGFSEVRRNPEWHTGTNVRYLRAIEGIKWK